jgi:hypothetical protein
MAEIQEIVDRMDPEEALVGIASVINKLFSHVSEEVRLNFVVKLIGDTGADKVSSLVHL